MSNKYIFTEEQLKSKINATFGLITLQLLFIQQIHDKKEAENLGEFSKKMVLKLFIAEDS